MSPRTAPGSDRRLTRLADEVRRDLLLTPPRLQPKFFYDALGSALFEAICRLPWYPITRAETRMLARHARDILAWAPRPVELVELGCGSGEKLIALLQAGPDAVGSIHLVDISEAALESARRLLAGSGVHHVTCHQGPFEDAIEMVSRRTGSAPQLVLFLGSNIGNFTPQEAEGFLASLSDGFGPGDRLLLGVDLVKPVERLLLAYDDPLGVTAAFNLNILEHLNRELGADFDLARFRHRAVWNETAGRVEMHLVSRADQRVSVAEADLQRHFAAGDYIWTESSYKYLPDAVPPLLDRAGLRCERQWCDEDARFMLALASRAS